MNQGFIPGFYLIKNPTIEDYFYIKVGKTEHFWKEKWNIIKNSL